MKPTSCCMFGTWAIFDSKSRKCITSITDIMDTKYLIISIPIYNCIFRPISWNNWYWSTRPIQIFMICSWTNINCVSITTRIYGFLNSTVVIRYKNRSGNYYIKEYRNTSLANITDYVKRILIRNTIAKFNIIK